MQVADCTLNVLFYDAGFCYVNKYENLQDADYTINGSRMDQCLTLILSITYITCYTNQGCGVLIVLWDSEFGVKKFRTRDSDFDFFTYHSCSIFIHIASVECGRIFLKR